MTLRTEAIRITGLSAEHADEVLAVYQLGIGEGNATFETTAPDWEAFDAAKPADHRHVALDHGGHVLGRDHTAAYTSERSEGFETATS